MKFIKTLSNDEIQFSSCNLISSGLFTRIVWLSVYTEVQNQSHKHAKGETDSALVIPSKYVTVKSSPAHRWNYARMLTCGLTAFRFSLSASHILYRQQCAIYNTHTHT